MVRMKLGYWYLCHPYSAQTIEGRISNFKLCCKRSAKLLLNGYNIFSPIVHSHLIEMASSEMLKWSAKDRWKFWINIDIALLEYVGFTGVILAPGWGASQGCQMEYDWFTAHQQPDGKPHDILQFREIVGD